MDLFALLDINNTLVNIPIGDGYAMSWIEAFGTVFGLLCIWFASQEKTINYLFGLLNVTLFAVIFFQIQLYGLLLLWRRIIKIQWISIPIACYTQLLTTLLMTCSYKSRPTPCWVGLTR